MVELQQGDFFASTAPVLVNTVNCVGIMGKGHALRFKQHFPEVMEPYQRACRTGWLKPGRLHWVQRADGRWLVNFATKDHWRNPSELPWIADGLKALAMGMDRDGLARVAMTAPGCTNGQLSFDTVLPMIEDAFRPYPGITVELYPTQNRH